MTTVAVIGDSLQNRRVMRDMAEAGHEVVWIPPDDRREIAGVRREPVDLSDQDGVTKRISEASLCLVGSNQLDRLPWLLEAISAAGATALIDSQRAGVYESLIASGTPAPAIFGTTWTPGASGVLAKLAAEQIGTVRSVRVSWFTSVSGPMGPQRLADVLLAMRGGAVFEAGEWHRSTGRGSQEVYFPEPFGWREVYPCAGVEVLSLPSTIGVSEQVAVFCATTQGVGRILSALSRSGPEDPGSLKGRATMMLASAVPRLPGRGASRNGWSCLRVDVFGEQGEQVSMAILDDVDHLNSAVILATLAVIDLDGSMPDALRTLEESVDPHRFVAALATRGVRIARLAR